MWLLRKPADGVQAKPSLLQPQVLAQGILKHTEIFLKEMRISIPTRGLKEKNDHHPNRTFWVAETYLVTFVRP